MIKSVNVCRSIILNKLCVFMKSKRVIVPSPVPTSRAWSLSLQEVGDKVQTSSAPPARLPGLCRLQLHFFLPPLILFLLQHLRFSLPSLPVPLLLLRAPALLLWSGGSSGGGRRDPKYWQNPPQAQAEPQFTARSHRRPPEGVGLQLGAAAAGSVWQQRVYGVKLRPEGCWSLPASEQEGRRESLTGPCWPVHPQRPSPSSSGPVKAVSSGDRRLLGGVAHMTDSM